MLNKCNIQFLNRRNVHAGKAGKAFKWNHKFLVFLLQLVGEMGLVKGWRKGWVEVGQRGRGRAELGLEMEGRDRG